MEADLPFAGVFDPDGATQDGVALTSCGVFADGSAGDEDGIVGEAMAGEVLEDGRGVGLRREEMEYFVATPYAAGGTELKKVASEQGGDPGLIAADGWIEQEHLGVEKLGGDGFGDGTSH